MSVDYFVSSNGIKAYYEKPAVDRTHQRKAIRATLSIVAIALCLCLVYLSWRIVNSRPSILSHVRVYIDTSEEASRAISPNFLSFGLDSSLLRDMKSLPITDERFIKLARHLSPAFVRIGGTSADCLFFNQITSNITWPIRPVDGQIITNFTLTAKSFATLYDFTVKSKIRMIFDLNVLIRNEDGSWNDFNAREVIRFAKSRGMELDWQLGNEPNSFYHVFNVTIAAAQLAEDYNKLRDILNKFGYRRSLLVGPESNHIGDINQKGELYVENFLKKEMDSIDYVTWHQYYLNGREAHVMDFINPATFNQLPVQIGSMQKAIDSAGKQIPMWLSETSTAYGGGAPGLSDRFVAGFLWLDKLGYSASAGVNTVIRQSFFGGNYAMIGPNIMPNPDWWISVMFKKFVSEKVLRIVMTGARGYVRMYAHCTPDGALINRAPAVTIYGVNIYNNFVGLDISQLFTIFTKNTKIFFYALTSDYLKSREIKLNGHALRLKPNDELPIFYPVIMEPKKLVELPPYSIIFIVIHGINVPFCLSE